MLNNFGLCPGCFEYYIGRLWVLLIILQNVICLFKWGISLVMFRLQVLILFLRANVSLVFKPFPCFLVQPGICTSWGLVLNPGSGLYLVHFLRSLLFSLSLYCVYVAWRQAQDLSHFIHRIRGISFVNSFLSGIYSMFSEFQGCHFPVPLATKIYFPQILAFSTVTKFFMTGGSHFAGHDLNSDFSPWTTCCLCLYLSLSIDTDIVFLIYIFFHFLLFISLKSWILHSFQNF